MLVDTHTHLQFSQFGDDRAEVLARAQDAGVERLVVIGIDLASSRDAVELAAQHPGWVWATAGFHPHEASALDAAALAELRELARRQEVVAVGETGLDSYRDRSPREAQRTAFRRQQELALELELPLVIHSRAALDEVYDELDRGGGFGTRVVLHCFTTRPDQVERFLARGCWLGMDGPVTYPKAADAHEVARKVPLERLLLETDCPYLAPQPHRGRRCEPWHVRLVAEQVARLRGLAVAEVTAATGAAAAAFYGWET